MQRAASSECDAILSGLGQACAMSARVCGLSSDPRSQLLLPVGLRVCEDDNMLFEPTVALLRTYCGLRTPHALHILRFCYQTRLKDLQGHSSNSHTGLPFDVLLTTRRQ